MNIDQNNIKAVRELLTDFTQPTTSTEDASYRHRLSGNYEMWRIARFLFAEVLNFRVWDQPIEKTNWVIPFTYKNQYHCSIVHEKFGFRIYIPNKSDSAEQLGKEIEIKLHKALLAAGPVIQAYAEDALKKGEIIVENTFRQLYKPYEFFRKRAQKKERITSSGLTTALKAPRNWFKSRQEKIYFERATYFCFFSVLEHLCVLFLGFKDIPEREDVAGFTQTKWSEKFKTIFDISDPQFKKFYDHFVGLARYQRNPAAHGNTNTVFDFYLESARHKISVSITDQHVALPWRDQKANFDMLESFIGLLKKHHSTKNIFAYINADMNISFSKSSYLENDRVVKMSNRELKEYLKYMTGLYDDMANMDW